MAKKIFLRARSEDARKHRREEIIQAAIFIIEKEGFNKLTMNAVAKKSKLGKATLYGYFETRGDLLLQVLQNDFDQWFVHFYTFLEKGQAPFGDDFIQFWIKEVEMNPRLPGGLLYLSSNDDPDLQASFAHKWNLYLVEKLREMHYQIIANFGPMLSFEKVSHFFVALTGITTGLWAQNKAGGVACQFKELLALDIDFSELLRPAIKGLFSQPEYQELSQLLPLQK